MMDNYLKNGILGVQFQPEQNMLNGILSPVTANRNMLAQAYNARQQPRNMLIGPETGYEAAQYAGMVPGLGLLGVAGDIQQYINKPESRNALAYGLTALGALPFLGAMAKMAGPMPKGILSNQAGAIFKKGSPSFERGPLSVPGHLSDKFDITPGGSAIYKDDPYLILRNTPDGKVISHYSPPWGSTSKEFHGVGDTFDEVLADSLARINRSDAAIAAASKAKYDKSVLGILGKEFGDNAFDVVNSQRSNSEYLIHKASGMKIRISDHPLPLGYPSADLDLPLSMSSAEKAEAIKKFLKE